MHFRTEDFWLWKVKENIAFPDGRFLVVEGERKYCISGQRWSGERKMTEKFMTKRWTVMALATISCILWGSGPASIKNGYQLFQIQPKDTMTMLLFAGMRFILAGVLIILTYSVLQKKPVVPKKSSWKGIVCLSLAQTIFQYLFYYIGNANASGVKVSILTGSNTFFCVFIACLIFRQEKLTRNKFLGCLAGIAGIIIVNLQGNMEAFSMDMTFIGEGFIVFSAVAGALASVLIRHFSKSIDPVMLSGYQFVLGGVVLAGTGYAGGGHLSHITLAGIAILAYMGFLSAMAYALWSQLLKYNPVSKVAVYTALIPIFGVIISAIVLGEGAAFTLPTLGSLLLVCSGIWLVNFVKQEN